MKGISVLMSVYGAEKPEYLDAALRSVWDDQTMKPQEIVLVEDGPLGSELESVIARWKSRLGDVLVLHANKSNLGLAKSLNIGLAYARGEYIARMDSDDISDAKRFERQVRYLEEHPEIAVLGGSIQEFNDNNTNLGIRRYPTTTEEVKSRIVKVCPLAHPTVMMRREIFENGYRYNERYFRTEDIVLWFSLLKAGYGIANISDVVLYFRRSDGVIMRRKNWKNARHEFLAFTRGIKSLYGIMTLKYIYPVSRLVFRMLPAKASERIYDSIMRKHITRDNK